MGVYQRTFDRFQYDLDDARGRSKRWFEQQVRLMQSTGDIKASKIISASEGENRLIVVPGDMYLFHYLPKHRKKLPLWDMYPLVIPFQPVQGGFIGLNFHFLSEQMRVYLLEELYMFRTTAQLNDETRILFQWKTVNAIARLSPAQECVRRYDYSYLRSSFKKIEPEDWVSALMLPLAQFHSGHN